MSQTIGDARTDDRTTARPVLAGDFHALHSYFNACPESPDGRTVLVYVSCDADAHRGDLCVVDRVTGERRTIAADVEAEDSHRQAHQQWIDGGRCVAFQNLVAGRWRIELVEVANGKRQVLLHDHLLGWSVPGAGAGAGIVPVYGPHWDPGKHVDLELLDVRTGNTETVVLAREVCDAVPSLVPQRIPGNAPVSIFFPILSPDLERVMFKLSAPTGSGFRTPKASHRQGLVVWDLVKRRLVGHRASWGHPAWHPDSRTIVNVANVLIATDTMVEKPIADLPHFPGSHPSISPDGHWLTTDTHLTPFGGSNGQWGVVIVEMSTGRWQIVHRASTIGGGTASFRQPHPHPAFSADSRRLYFNVNLGAHTSVHVLEAHSWNEILHADQAEGPGAEARTSSSSRRR